MKICHLCVVVRWWERHNCNNMATFSFSTFGKYDKSRMNRDACWFIESGLVVAFPRTDDTWQVDKWVMCIIRYVKWQSTRALRTRSQCQNGWQVYPTTNVNDMNQPWEQYDSSSLGSLYARCKLTGGVGGSAVGRGTALQIGRSRVRFPTMSLRFFVDVILPAAQWTWGWLSL